MRYQIIRALNQICDTRPDLQLPAGPVRELLKREIAEAFGCFGKLHLRTSMESEPEIGVDEIESIDQLKAQYDRAVERVFRLLGLLFVQRDIYAADRGLKSPRSGLKANAVEFLDNLLPDPIRKTVLSLVDDETPVEEKLKIAETLSGNPSAHWGSRWS